jgi:hypothetical protein
MGKTYRSGDGKFQKFAKTKTRKSTGMKLQKEVKIKKLKNFLDEE